MRHLFWGIRTGTQGRHGFLDSKVTRRKWKAIGSVEIDRMNKTVVWQLQYGVLLWVLVVTAPGNGGDRIITVESLLNEMIDRESVARFPQPDFRLRAQTSYDRDSKTPDDPKGWFANRDATKNFVRIEERSGRKEWVIMDARGPGVIVRSWMPDRRIGPGRKQDNTTIRIYLDDNPEPAIQGHALDLFNGTSLVPYPLAHPSLASAVSFFPIPYAKSCKIALDQQPFYYILTYREYPAGTPVRTFTMKDFQAAAAITRRIGDTLLHPEGRAPGKMVSLSATLTPNQEKSVSLPGGAGAVRSLSVKLGRYDDPRLTRAVVLKMSFDGRETVWCPVGDFFGTGVGLHPFQGWHRTVSRDGTMTCRWIMPYRESGVISLVNLHDQPVDVALDAVVGDWTWDDRSMYFHANWRQQYPLPTRPFSDWNYVTLKGRGVYVGDTLTVMNPLPAWWGEGDAKIWVDGESFPSIFDTGTEDYYGYSWGGQHTMFYEHPFHAQVRAHRYDQLVPQSDLQERNTQGYSTETRTRALDTMPFGKSLQVDMEVWHSKECEVAYTVATYWYGFADTTSNRRPDPEQAAARLPQPPPAPAEPQVRHFENATESARR